MKTVHCLLSIRVLISDIFDHSIYEMTMVLEKILMPLQISCQSPTEPYVDLFETAIGKRL